MAKKMDLKQFLLEKGERVGLGAALAIMALMLVVCVYDGVSRESPAATAQAIETASQKIEKKLQEDPPTTPLESDVDKVPLDSRTLLPGNYQWDTDLAIEDGRENKRRTNPTPLAPREFQVDVMRAQLKTLVIVGQGENARIGILVPKEREKDRPAAPNPADIWQQRTGGGNWGNAPRVNAATLETVKELTKDEKGVSTDKYEMRTLSIKDKAVEGAKWAYTVHPQRLVVLEAAFPYRQQLEVYRKALKLNSLNELAAQKELMPSFAPCKVRRRLVPPNGKPREEDWEEVKLEEFYEPIVRTMEKSEPESKELKGVIFPGPLVMRLPKVARGDYPRVDPQRMPELTKAAKAMAAKLASGQPVPTLSPLQQKLGGVGVSVYDDVTAPDEKREEVKNPEAKSGEELVVPEYCLIRLVDADPKLRTGATYQYQIKVRMANPNYKAPRDKLTRPELAEKPVLESDWGPADPRKDGTEVTVSRELFFYPTELDDKALYVKTKSDSKLINDRDVAWLQAHQWFDSIQLNPDNPATRWPVGDWVVADIPVRRGEYVTRRENVEVPVWVPTREGYEFAIPVGKARPAGGGRPAPGIPVDFGPREPANLELLVDFDGGKVEQSFKVGDKPAKNIKEDAALEILVMAPDGTLRVQNSHQELKDSRRKEREENIRAFQDEVRKKSRVGGTTGGLLPPKN